MYSVLNTLSEYTYFYISKNITSSTFVACFLKSSKPKKKFLRHNNNPFMIKDLRKQIMVRSKLRNTFNKNRNYDNWCKYGRQRNLCLKVLRKTKKSSYKNLDEN